MPPLTEKQRQLHDEARRLLQAGAVAGAVETCQRIVKKSPDQPAVLLDLAEGLMRLGRYGEAARHLERVPRLAPSIAADAAMLLAHCHGVAGKYDKAIRAADLAIERRPRFREAILKKAELLHMVGEYDQALAALQPFIDDGSATIGMRFEHGRLCRLLDRPGEAESSLRSAADDPHAARAQRSEALFELAALLESRGDNELAWATAVEANNLQDSRFKPAAHEAMIDRVIAAWTPEAVAAAPRSSVLSEKPVFIVGMPRSGTTLVEQILASHRRVHGGGERSEMFRLVAQLQPRDVPDLPAHIDDLGVLTARKLDEAGRGYLRHLSRSAQRDTDKQPFNFLYLGPISLMLPGARVIHCVRDPLDTAVSCYFQSFMGTVWFANRLENIGVFMRTYRRLMDHWKAVLTDLPILDVVYEELIADPERVSREMVEFLGLEWDDACLEFHKTRRTAWSASIDQVRRPVYTSSAERWRRYEAHLGPLRDLIGVP